MINLSDARPTYKPMRCSNRRGGVLPKVYDSADQCHDGAALCGPTAGIIHDLASDTIFVCGGNE
jgi:hypothetical protein